MRTLLNLVGAAMTAASVLVAPDAGTTIPLPAADRAALDEYLGKGVVGDAVEAHPISDVHAFMKLDVDRATWIHRGVHGPGRGKTETATLQHVTKGDGTKGLRFDSGGNTVSHSRVAPDGSVIRHASEDRKNRVISHYTPPQPVVRVGMEPGSSVELDIAVAVFDIDDPTKQKHKGKLHLTYRYLGAYEVHVPAGTFETALFKWHYKGKVGPAKVEDVQYWFYAEGIGPVAMVDETDVSAFLVYQDHTKSARTLVKRVDPGGS
jgi:hypothetical protein